VGLSADTTFRTPRPVGIFRNAYINPFVWRSTNVDNLVIDSGAGLEVGITGLNQWNCGLGGRVSPPYDDDRETRGGIPWHNDSSGGGWAWISTDPRPNFRAGAGADLSSQQGGHKGSLNVWARWFPVPFISLNLSVTGRSVVNIPRWVENVTDERQQIHSIFGQQNAAIVETNLRASVAFTRHLTLDLFSQLLTASLRYDHFAELVAPDQLVPSFYGGQPNYDSLSLIVNAVARYEYIPGSYLTLVLLHRSNTSLAPGAPYYGTGLGTIAATTPDTSILVKLTYLSM
jgi:hypothetical protein